MPNFYTDNEDLQYYVRKGIDWTELIKVTEFLRPGCDAKEQVEETVETYRDMLEMIGTFASEEIATRAAAIDRAVEMIGEGDVAVIAGKGHETGQIVGDQVLPFDDLLVARGAIDQAGGVPS